jgi:hypothetical protein
MSRVRKLARKAKRFVQAVRTAWVLDLSDVDWTGFEEGDEDSLYGVSNPTWLDIDLPEAWDTETFLVVTGDDKLEFQTLDEMDADVRERHLAADAFLAKVEEEEKAKVEPTYSLTFHPHRWELPDADIVELMVAVDALDLEYDDVAEAWGLAVEDIKAFYAGGEESAHTQWMEHIAYDVDNDSKDAMWLAEDVALRMDTAKGRGKTMTYVREETVADFLTGSYEEYVSSSPECAEVSKPSYIKMYLHVNKRERIIDSWLSRGQ